MLTCTANTGSPALFSDRDLIRLTLEGQADCFTALMDRHLGAVKRCIGFMLRGNCAAEDLAQEVVLKAWRFLSAFRAESSFRTWLTRVAINEVRQFQRRELRYSMEGHRVRSFPGFTVSHVAHRSFRTNTSPPMRVGLLPGFRPYDPTIHRGAGRRI